MQNFSRGCDAWRVLYTPSTRKLRNTNKRLRNVSEVVAADRQV
jgi:hypothetical protein